MIQMVGLLERLVRGELDLVRLAVTYDDLHPFWGGLRLTILGNGSVEQRAVRHAVVQTKPVTPEELIRLTNMLLEEEAWSQRVPDRTMVPDESRAFLTIRYGEEESVIWERVGELQRNQRMVHIRDLMFDIACATAGNVSDTGTSSS